MRRDYNDYMSLKASGQIRDPLGSQRGRQMIWIIYGYTQEAPVRHREISQDSAAEGNLLRQGGECVKPWSTPALHIECAHSERANKKGEMFDVGDVGSGWKSLNITEYHYKSCYDHCKSMTIMWYSSCLHETFSPFGAGHHICELSFCYWNSQGSRDMMWLHVVRLRIRSYFLAQLGSTAQVGVGSIELSISYH